MDAEVLRVCVQRPLEPGELTGPVKRGRPIERKLKEAIRQRAVPDDGRACGNPGRDDKD
jgi:hypothetical protein